VGAFWGRDAFESGVLVDCNKLNISAVESARNRSHNMFAAMRLPNLNDTPEVMGEVDIGVD
jgi:hypothetical protein